MSKRKAPLYDRNLDTEIGNLRELADRLGVVLHGVRLMQDLFEAIEQDHPNTKKIAETIKPLWEAAMAAIDNSKE